jgi:hypothetical protein
MLPFLRVLIDLVVSLVSICCCIFQVAAAALFLRIPFGMDARTSVVASAESSSLLPGPPAVEAVSEPSGFKTIGQCLAVAMGSSFYVCHGLAGHNEIQLFD